MSLTVQKLAKRYEDQWILRDVSFEAQAGEITGIFGATSAGKTTLIRILAGNEKCNGGKIYHNESDVSEITCENRGFLIPKLKNSSFWKSLFKTDEKPEISEGEGQILALEEAIKNAKGVVLLDDTFCFMDKPSREKHFGNLRRAAKEKNLTVIFAGNDFEEIFALCDKVGVLANGEIQQFGIPREIYEKPANLAVAKITGINNIIRARRLSSTKIESPEFITLDGEHTIFADKTEKRALGAINQNICLAIRPEHISISFGASFPEDNLLKATITEIIFQGATTLIRLDAKGLELCALVLRLVGLNIGDECVVGLPPDRILVLKD